MLLVCEVRGLSTCSIKTSLDGEGKVRGREGGE